MFEKVLKIINIVNCMSLNNKKLDPDLEGITHINAYSQSRTKLGLALSNMSNIGFTHKQYGKFNTVEGFYWWLKTGKQTKFFKFGSGFDCRNLGKELSDFYVDFDINEVKRAIALKIFTNRNLLHLMLKNHLVIEHYYVNKGTGTIYIPKGKWFKTTLNRIQEYIIKNRELYNEKN